MNIFEKHDYEALRQRLQNFDKTAERQWGCLTHEQMLAHCTKALKVATTVYKRQYFIGKLFGKMIVKNILSNRYEMKKSIKSSKKLFETHPKSFDEEKEILLKTLKAFYENGPDFYENKLHPFFGRLPLDVWNTLTYKHLNHHLRQFSS